MQSGYYMYTLNLPWRHRQISACSLLELHFSDVCRELFSSKAGVFNLWPRIPGGPRATTEKLETRRILTKQKHRPYQSWRVQATTYRIENFAGVCYAMSEVWTRLNVAYLLAYLCSRSLTHVLIISYVQWLFGCFARNLGVEFKSFGYAILIRHVLASTKGWSRCALGRGVRHPTLEFLWGPQRDKGWKQWRNDGMAAASSDGGPTGGRAPNSSKVLSD